MIFRFHAVLLASIAACLADDDKSVVRFSNGDQLTGEVLSLSGDKLKWKSQILVEPAEFELRQIVDLSMPAGGVMKPANGFAHKAVLEMENGDRIEGQLAGLTKDEVKLSTRYGGELAVRRVNVRSVKIVRIADTIFRGPNSMEEWTTTGRSGAWQFRGGSLESKSVGGIAREIEFPDECVIAFDAAWRGSLRTKVVLFSDNTKSLNPDNGYEMTFQGNYVLVKKCGSNNMLGQAKSVGAFRENEKARIEIKASRKSGKIVLYVDGRIMDVWEDGDVAKAKFGKGLHFISLDPSPLRISNIEVTGWDGYHDAVPNNQVRMQGRFFNGGFQLGGEFDEEEEPVEEKLPEGRMLLVNGDSIEGEVTKVVGEQITLKTPYAEVTFPIVRLKNIVLSPAGIETPKRYKGDVRATFGDGSKLVFRFDGVDGDKILGFSQHFGNARFSRDAFRRLEFNIYDEAMATMRITEEW